MVSFDFHHAKIAKAEISNLANDTMPDLGHVLRIRVQRAGERETVAMTMFGTADDLRAICRAIGAAADVAAPAVEGKVTQ